MQLPSFQRLLKAPWGRSEGIDGSSGQMAQPRRARPPQMSAGPPARSAPSSRRRDSSCSKSSAGGIATAARVAACRLRDRSCGYSCSNQSDSTDIPDTPESLGVEPDSPGPFADGLHRGIVPTAWGSAIASLDLFDSPPTPQSSEEGSSYSYSDTSEVGYFSEGQSRCGRPRPRPPPLALIQ